MKNLLAVKYADETTLYDLDEEMEVKAIVFRYDLEAEKVEIVWEYENEKEELEVVYNYTSIHDPYVVDLDDICMEYGELSCYGNRKMSVQTFVF